MTARGVYLLVGSQESSLFGGYIEVLGDRADSPVDSNRVFGSHPLDAHEHTLLDGGVMRFCSQPYLQG